MNGDIYRLREEILGLLEYQNDWGAALKAEIERLAERVGALEAHQGALVKIEELLHKLEANKCSCQSKAPAPKAGAVVGEIRSASVD